MNYTEQDNRWKVRARGCATLLVAFILLPLFLFAGCQWSNAPPSDEDLTQEFQRNRQSFDVLLKMIREEQQVSRVANDFIRIDGYTGVADNERSHHLPDERLTKYKKLFEVLKLEGGVERYEDGSVGFYRSANGIVTSGSSKGYLWGSPYPSPVLQKADPRSLEEACLPKTGCSVARRIAPNWYITFESY